MWQYKLLICCAAVALGGVAYAGQLNSAQVSYYHYPTPNRPLTIPPQHQHQYQQRPPAHYAQQQGFVNSRPQQYQHQQQQQQYRPAAAQQQLSFITAQARPSAAHLTYHQQQQQQRPVTPAVQQQFSAPALENAAFTTALTNQGYVFGGAGAGAGAGASSAGSSARSLPLSPPPSTSTAVDTSDASQNVKLPLPINVVPIKNTPLPLQAGAPFDSIHHTVTSYGTVYPQRKR